MQHQDRVDATCGFAHSRPHRRHHVAGGHGEENAGEVIQFLPNDQALAPLGRRGALRQDGGLKLRKAWPTELPQRLSSRALFALGWCGVLVSPESMSMRQVARGMCRIAKSRLWLTVHQLPLEGQPLHGGHTNSTQGGP